MRLLPDVPRTLPARPARRASLAVAALLLAGCTSTPGPDPDDAGAQAAADALAAALADGDVTPVAFAGTTGADVEAQLEPLVAGMGPVAPAVSAGPVSTDGDTARSTLSYRWTFPGVPTPWSYETPAELVREAGTWKARWQPTLLEPSLDGAHRLSQRRLYPERGEILGEDGDPLVTLRSVVRIGIDKTAVSGSAATTSARRLAKLVDVDADDYVEKVEKAGSAAFVEALTVRAEADDRPDDEDVFAIRGALPVEDRQMLAPSRTFARSLLGTVGEATKEDVDAADGAVVAGDQVGRSGLQERYDEQLRGVPGVQVTRATLDGGASPSPRPTADPSPSASPTPAADLHRVAPTAGKPLELTLNQTLQSLAESVLADTEPASALVAVRPSTGAVLATGQLPPGSTFKVASSLALLRAGLTPTSAVRCPATLEVDGFRFENYDDYPSAGLGRIDLQTALAQSCNTAFIGARDQLGEGDLAEAAASLGLGQDYDVGFPSFFGAVPEETSETGRGAAMIGQAKDQASPLAMAAVAASVQGGETVVPHLVTTTTAQPNGAPLTEEEAGQLRAMMRRVVTQGSARNVLGDLEGPPVIAKTGTAEYGDDEPRGTHAWMIGAQGDLAVAVFVADGASGSRTAGPLLSAFLRGAR